MLSSRIWSRTVPSLDKFRCESCFGALPVAIRNDLTRFLNPVDGLRDGRKAIAQDDGEEWNRPQKGFVLYGICTVL